MGTSQRLAAIGALFGFLTVAFGAFGAHGLEDKLSEQALEIYQTAVGYQGLHALALLITALFAHHKQSVLLKLAGYAFAVGIVIFSGSLYLLALTSLGWLGAITPIGGLSFLVGWAALFGAFAIQRE